MISSYSRPGSIDPLFSKPAFLRNWLAEVGRPFNSICRCPVLFRLCAGGWMSSNHLSKMKSQSWQPPKESVIKCCLTPLFNDFLRLHVSSFFDLGNLGMLGLISTAHTQKSTHSTGDIALRAHTQKSSYSARILRNHRTRQMGAHTAKICKNRKKKKKSLQSFFFPAKKPWNLIIWNMGEIVVFPAFWAVAHTIAFHEIQVV